MDAGSVTITIMFQARKERRVHGKKDKKWNKGKENQINKPKFVIFQVCFFFFPQTLYQKFMLLLTD